MTVYLTLVWGKGCVYITSEIMKDRLGYFIILNILTKTKIPQIKFKMENGSRMCSREPTFKAPLKSTRRGPGAGRKCAPVVTAGQEPLPNAQKVLFF